MNQLVADALKDSVFAKYRLVGALWMDDERNEHGTLALSNITMETFEQPINCLICHGENAQGVPQFNPAPYPFNPIAAGINDRSFAFQRLKFPGEYPECNRLADSCDAHGWIPAEVCQLPPT